MEIDNETLKIVVSGLVWIVGLLVFGRLGVFIASSYFAHLKSTASKPAIERTAEALHKMQE
jgi:hypothetical protein